MITIDEDHYYIGMWFFEVPPQLSRHGLGGDFMMCISRPINEPLNWKIQFRFRHKRDSKIWESDDEKKWFEAVATGESEEELKQKTDVAVRTMALVADQVPHFFEVRGNGTVFSEKAVANPPPWMHARLATPEEIESISKSSTTSSKAAA